MKTQPAAQERIGPFQLLLLGLSVYVLVALAIEKALPLGPDSIQILDRVDNAICVVFIADFFYRLFRAPRKGDFLKWGWIDLVASIPTMDFLRWGRLARVIRVLRVLRGLRSIRVIFRTLFANRSHGAFATVIFVCAVLIPVASVAILHVENDPESNIKNAGDALWWATATITTVGYGDRYPVTSEGRSIAALLMLVGIGAFGSFTALAATWFVAGGAEQTEHNEEVLAEIKLLRDEVFELRAQLAAPGGTKSASSSGSS